MDRNERNKGSKEHPEGTRTKKATAAAEAKPASAAPQPKGRQGPRFTKAHKKYALLLIVSGMKRTEVAEGIGTTCESLRRSMVAGKADGTVPTPPGSADRPSAADAESAAGESPGSSGGVPRSVYAPREPGTLAGDTG